MTPEENLNKILSDELSKSINEDILLDILVPETKGMDNSDRWDAWKIKKRNNQIDSILNDSKFEIDLDIGKIKFVNVSKDKLDLFIYPKSDREVLSRSFNISKDVVFKRPGISVVEYDTSWSISDLIKNELDNGEL